MAAVSIGRFPSESIARSRAFLDKLQLTPTQIAAVLAVFIVTLTGAIALAYAFRWWNRRLAISAD